MRRPAACALLAFLTLPALLLAAAPLAAEELGRVDFPTSARSPEAQRQFLRGLAALHSFWYDEAADAFRAARAAEPGFALAHWGEALSHHHPIWAEEDLEASRAALAALAPTAAERAAKAPTEREKGYLAAVETLFGDGDRAAREARYAEAMERHAARFPDDLEAASLWALAVIAPALNAEAGEARTRALVRAAARLEELFDRTPEHPGVVHYLIHAYDDPTHAPLGLRAARVYARVAPAAHHALHMPSHIFVQLGRWEEAIASNQAAWAASAAWVERRGLAPDKRDFHSLSWLHYAQLQMERVEAARATLAIARAAAAEAPTPRTANALRTMEARQLVEAGEAPAVRTAAATDGAPAPAAGGGPHAGHGGGDSGPRGADLLARGLAAARAGDLAGAATIETELAALAAEAGPSYRDRPLRIAAKEVAGVLRVRQGKIEEGLALLAEAAVLEAEMPPPMGPPEPVKPAAELLGETLLDLGRPAEAAARFAEALLRMPNRALSVRGAERATAALTPPAAR